MRQETWETDSAVSDTVMQGIPRGFESGRNVPRKFRMCGLSFDGTRRNAKPGQKNGAAAQ